MRSHLMKPSRFNHFQESIDKDNLVEAKEALDDDGMSIDKDSILSSLGERDLLFLGEFKVSGIY